MTKRLSILLLMLPALGATAQSVRLTHYDAPSALYANLDRLYNYNRYEKSRIELGATWVTPNETAQQSRPHTGQWTLEGYAAYGFGDKAFKYGGSAQLRLLGLHNVRLRLRAYNDVEAAASRRLDSYRMLAPDYNTNFLSSHYVGMKGARADISFSPNRQWELTLGAAMNWVDYRFHGGVMVPSGCTCTGEIEPDGGGCTPTGTFGRRTTEPTGIWSRGVPSATTA